MHINPLASTPTPPQATSNASGSAGTSANDTTSPLQSTDNMFLQLLTTQLQNQSPLDPVDPDQFTTELVQFNMLDQLSQINGFLQTSTIAPPAAGTTSSSSSNSNSSNAAAGIAQQGEN